MRISDWSSDVCSSDLKAIVTGSTAGIGRAIAEGLARAGAAVVINGRTQKRVDAALRELHVRLPGAELTGVAADVATDRMSVGLGKRVSVREDLVGRRTLTKKIQTYIIHYNMI